MQSRLKRRNTTVKVGDGLALNLFLVDPLAGFKKMFHSASRYLVGDIAPKDLPHMGVLSSAYDFLLGFSCVFELICL